MIDPKGLFSIWNVPSFSNEVQSYTNIVENTINNASNITVPNPFEGIGGGAYWGGGAETSYSCSSCCENGTKYKVEIVTVCGGAGLGLKGTLPINAKIKGISSQTGCPDTRYYFKHETVFLLRSTNVQADSLIPSAGIDAGIYGISTAWVFCSDTVISKKKVGCCND